MTVELSPERWQRINQMLETVKQEGDFGFLQAMEDLLESCIAWRSFGVAFRNLAENFESRDFVAEARRERDACLAQASDLRRESDDMFFRLRDIRNIVEGCLFRRGE